MPIAFPYHIDRTGRTAAPEDMAAHVRQLIEQVLFTAPGERVNRPNFGTGVHQFVFAPGGEQLATAAQHLLRGALSQWLAEYIEVQNIEVVARESTLEITIHYLLRQTNELQAEVFRMRGLSP